MVTHVAIETTSIPLPKGYNAALPAHEAQLLKIITEKMGPGWQIEGTDSAANVAHLSRRSNTLNVTQDADDKALAKQIDLPLGTKEADGPRIAAKQAEIYPGYFLTVFKPHVGKAILERKTEEELRCREAVANALRCKPWDVQVQSRKDGGYALQLPGSYNHTDAEKKKLQDVAEGVVGKFGWYVKVNPQTLVAQIIPSEPPTFPDMCPLPMNQLGTRLNRSAFGLKLPPAGEKAKEPAEIDWKAQSFMLLAGTAGSGKSCEVSTNVPVPLQARFSDGWAKHGDLRVGDLVFAPDGSVVEVDEVTDREVRECFRVTFEDGDSVVVSDHHLWSVSSLDSRDYHRAGRTALRDEAAARRQAQANQIRAIADEVCPMKAGASVADLAKLFGCSMASTRKVINAKNLPYETVGQTRVYPVDEFAMALADMKLNAYQSKRVAPIPLESIQTTSDMADLVKDSSKHKVPNNNWAVRRIIPSDTPDDSLPLDPYLLGAWLGDGSSNAGGVTVGPDDIEFMVPELEAAWGAPHHRFVTHTQSSASTFFFGRPDPERCKRGHAVDWRGDMETGKRTCRGCANYKDTSKFGVNESLTERLHDMGLVNNKHIPAQYLRAGFDQRLALLQGLMDTDGNVSPAGECSFAASREGLARQVLELARSLGLRAKMTRRAAQYTKTEADGQKVHVKCKDTYKVSFQTILPVFRMPRKLARVPERLQVGSWNHIVAIEPVGKREVNCIRVNHPEHLYVIGENWIPTHNTVTINDILADQIALGAEVFVIDDVAKQVDFAWAKDYVADGGWGCNGLRESVTTLRLMYERGQARAAKMAELGYVNWQDMPESIRFKPMFLVADEFSALTITEKIPPGIDKGIPEIQEMIQNNLLRFKIQNWTRRIMAEQRFVGARVLTALQVSNAATGMPPSMRALYGHKFLQGSNPSKTQRQQAFNVEDSVPRIPPNLVGGGLAAKGIGAAELEGQDALIYKGFYASTDALRAELDRRGAPKTSRPDPTPEEMDRLCPLDEGEDDLDDEGPSPMIAGETLPSGKPVGSLDAKFGPVATVYDENGKPLKGAALAAAQSKQISQKTGHAVLCPDGCGQPIASDGSCGCA